MEETVDPNVLAEPSLTFFFGVLVMGAIVCGKFGLILNHKEIIFPNGGIMPLITAVQIR